MSSGSPAVVVIDDKSKPANIPDCATIITQCFALGPQQVTATNVSGVRIDLQPTSRSVHDASTIWVKFGCTITMGEAKTQRYVAQYLRDHDNPAVRLPRVYLAFTWGVFGFIVAEYIDGQICDYSDIPLVAAAVQALITIPSPGPKPGRVGGGLIEHPFFIDRMSSIEYESVEELQDHINGILSVTGKGGHVDFSDELAQYGLRLCVSDLQPVNFMKDRDGRIVAVDCGGYSFLPPSFFGLALKFGDFAHRVSTILQFPRTNVAVLMSASCALVPFSSNDIGVPRRLRSRRAHYPDAAHKPSSLA